jgi:RHS repeat-associated protein
MNWDAGSRLRQTVIGGTTTNLLYDGERLVAEYDVSGNLLRRYVHGSGVDEPLVKYEGAGTTSKSWYYADHLGSVVANADATGIATATYTHGPFGELGNTPPGRFGYTGQQYFAALGLYHYKARFYSPTLGRFLQTDPIGFDGGINLYAYVGNNPLNAIDPNGEGVELAASLPGIIGAVIGGESGFIGAFHDPNATVGNLIRGTVVGAAVGAATAYVSIGGPLVGAITRFTLAGFAGNSAGQLLAGPTYDVNQALAQGAISAVSAGYGNELGLIAGLSAVSRGGHCGCRDCEQFEYRWYSRACPWGRTQYYDSR